MRFVIDEPLEAKFDIFVSEEEMQTITGEGLLKKIYDHQHIERYMPFNEYKGLKFLSWEGKGLPLNTLLKTYQFDEWTPLYVFYTQLPFNETPEYHRFPLENLEFVREGQLSELNFWQKQALKVLPDLTAGTLCCFRKQICREFSQWDLEALCNLVKKYNLKIDDALLSIRDLTPFQVMGISLGLKREDVIDLTNYWHIKILAEFKDAGLTAAMLLKLKEDVFTFGEWHYDAIRNWIKREGGEISEALLMIDELSSVDLNELANRSHTPENEIGLHNFWRLRALAELKKNYLAMPSHFQKNNLTFDESHYRGLYNSIKTKLYSAGHLTRSIFREFNKSRGLSTQGQQHLPEKTHGLK